MSRKIGKLPTKSEFLLILFSIIFTLILCEFAARYWFNNLASIEQIKKYGLYSQVPSKYWRLQPHHYLNYSLSPNFKKGATAHNSMGFRGKEFLKEKPDSIFRIVCLGGSTTYTEFVEDDTKTYPALIEQILKEEYGHQNIEVINAGVPGYNSWESLINLEFRVLELDPDLVIVYHGTNDVHPRLIPPKKYVGDNTGGRKQWRDPPISIYDNSALLRILRRKYGYSKQAWLADLVIRKHYYMKETREELLAANPPVFYEKNLKSMIGLAKVHDFEIMFGTWAYSPEFKDYAATPPYMNSFKENNEVMKKLGTEFNIPVYDFGSEMPTDKVYWHDGRHVNEEGCALKASLFAKFLNELKLR